MKRKPCKPNEHDFSIKKAFALLCSKCGQCQVIDRHDAVIPCVANEKGKIYVEVKKH